MKKHSARIVSELKIVFGTDNPFTVKGAIERLKERPGVRHSRCPTTGELSSIFRYVEDIELIRHDWKANEYMFTG